MMPCLVYCLFAGQDPPPTQTPPGVGGGAVEVTGLDGLGAAISWVDGTPSTPPVAELLAYGRVVEAFHEQRTVIPLRYGCLCRDREQVAALLDAGRGRFQPLLAQLAGCVEMGIRALVPAGDEGEYISLPESPPSLQDCAARAKASERPGLAYLSARRGSGQLGAPRAGEEGDLPARCRTALDGLFLRSLSEGPVQAQGPGKDEKLLLSLYFLILRPKVQAFRQAFIAFSRQESAKLMLNGPWPPYSFAAPQVGYRGGGGTGP